MATASEKQQLFIFEESIKPCHKQASTSQKDVKIRTGLDASQIDKTRPTGDCRKETV
jgi:hypothetical protein